MTSARELAFLKNLFTMGTQWGKGSENPVKQVRLLREDNGRIRFLVPHTGFRKSELFALTWSNTDFRHSLITVEAACAKHGEARSVAHDCGIDRHAEGQ